MTPLIATGNSTNCAWFVSLFGSRSVIWLRKSTFTITGSDTPVAVTARSSRAPSGASGATVTLTRSFLSSSSPGTIPPRLLSRLAL